MSTDEELIRMARSELRDVDEGRFTPLVVPIGPYHRVVECLAQLPEEKKKHHAELLEKKKHAELVEEKKKGAVDKVLRPGYVKRDKTMDELNALVDKARACYPDLAIRNSRLLTNSKEFVQMLLHDGCYVLSFLVVYRSKSEASDGHTHEAGSEEEWVMRDTLFLLENQIPWFVLEKLHHCIVGSEDRSVLDDLSGRVRRLLQNRLHISGRQRWSPSDPKPPNLLHLVHAYFMPTQDPTTAHLVLDVLSDKSPPAREERMGRWRRAAEYCRYGNVKLRRRDLKAGEADSVLDVRLQGRTLWMPCLLIDSSTWTILRNLMALEEGMSRRPVTAYCVFMSQLACKVEDVELLQRSGIIQQFLGNDDEVVRGFAGLCKEVVLDVDSLEMNYLNRTWYQLQELCQSKRNNLCGFFREIHGGSYVHIFAFAGAVLLFIFQMAQVIRAAFSLHKQKKCLPDSKNTYFQL